MPLISFPDVPPLAGVPDLARVPLAIGVHTGVVQAIEGLDYFGLLDRAAQWVLADDNGVALVTPDSMVELGYHGEHRVCTHPVEQGGFAAYNKVAQPQELTLRLSCGGRNMPRDSFLFALDTLRTSLTLINVVTPDFTYRGYNVTRVDYARKGGAGLSLITADIHVAEIPVTAQASYTNTAQPSGSDPQNQGWVCTATDLPAPTNQLTPLQQAVAGIKDAYCRAAQSVSTIVDAVTREAAQATSGVTASLETAVSGMLM